MDNNFPEQLQTAYRGMERTLNPWNISPAERMNWAKGFKVPTIIENPDFDLLWWVGCAPATDNRAQKAAQAFASILKYADVNYAVLGEAEQCTGDSARRSGNEYLFHELALANVKILNDTAPKRIVTTCPHCLHTIKNEYPAYGGEFEVIHHSQLINELAAAGKLKIEKNVDSTATFHDPCYLGRINSIIQDPRQTLQHAGIMNIEMGNFGAKSFCCGAGGGQMWKEEENGMERVGSKRIREAANTNANKLVVGCPFCMIMLEDANMEVNTNLEILDLAEIVAAQIEGK
jgi:Fe-S oxidoreductase